jgi:hypothetical protein
MSAPRWQPCPVHAHHCARCPFPGTVVVVVLVVVVGGGGGSRGSSNGTGDGKCSDLGDSCST